MTKMPGKCGHLSPTGEFACSRRRVSWDCYPEPNWRFWVLPLQDDDYSPTEHLAYAVWPDGRLRGCHFMMLTGFFDDSGHVDNGRVLIASGFVAPVGQWKLFEKDWSAILRHPDFEIPYVHMKEFRNYKDKFARFKNNLALETSLFKQLHRAIHNRAAESFGCVVLLDAWDAANKEFAVEERYGHPFALAGAVTVHNAIRWMRQERPESDRIKFVFDHGTDGRGFLEKECKDRWGVIPVPGDFREDSPLQAADHLAWEMHRATNQVLASGLAPNSVKFRTSFDQLIHRWEGENWNWIDESELRNLCAHPGGPKPR